MKNNPHFQPENNSVLIKSDTVTKYICSFCMFTQVQDETFMALPSLEKLILNFNKIEYVSPHAFLWNPKVSVIQMGKNNLVSFNEIGQLNHLPNLNLLTLSWNEEFTFTNLTEFRTSESLTIECFKCGNVSIFRNTFRHALNLFKIDMNGSRDIKVETGSFNNNHGLKYLDFSDKSSNLLDIFDKPIDSIETFICNNCSMVEVPLKMLQWLPRLKTLQLNKNQIREIPMDLHLTNPSLVSIQLNENKITKISPDFLLHKKDLRNFCIDKNPFVPSWTHSRFKQLYKERNLRKNCKSIEGLTFENDPIDLWIDGTVLFNETGSVVMDSFKHINISNRDLIYIDRNFFIKSAFRYVQSLDMSSNQMFQFPVEYVFLVQPNLLEFICDYCNNTHIYRKTFSNLTGLEKISLRHNQITHVALEAFQYTIKLRILRLDNNHLIKLDYLLFEHLLHFQTLMLNNNKHFVLPEQIFLYSDTIQTFKCTHCKIVHILTDPFLRMPNLKYLDLRDNPIEEIATDAFENNPNLTEVHITDNSLLTSVNETIQNCFCSLKYLEKLCIHDCCDIFKSVCSVETDIDSQMVEEEETETQADDPKLMNLKQQRDIPEVKGSCSSDNSRILNILLTMVVTPLSCFLIY